MENKNTNTVDTTKTTAEKREIPKTAFDMEYSTMMRKEYQFLKDRGFEPSFIRTIKPYGIPQYKYTKTPELFMAVATFYMNHAAEMKAAKTSKEDAVNG